MLRIAVVTVTPKGKAYFEVTPIWEGVDRIATDHYCCPSEKLALRLRAGILCGAVITDPTIKTDVHGNTYASYKFIVSLKNLDADLTELGF